MVEFSPAHANASELVFHDTSFSARTKLQKEFRTAGPDGFYQVGMIAEALPSNEEGFRSIVHFADPYQGLTLDKDNKLAGNADAPLTIVSLPSYATVDEVQALREKMIPMPETCEMLQALAEAKDMNNIMLIVGGTALGKTYVVKSFVKALYGPDAHPLDFYCNGQTDVSELHGMWVPKVTSAADTDRWRSFLMTADADRKLSAITTDLDAASGLSDEQRIAGIQHRLKVLAQEIGLGSGASWEFALGAVPKAYHASFDPEKRVITGFPEGGRGYPLHIQEVGLATPRVVNALLEIRGDNGALSDSVQIWRNGGQIVRRGPETLVVMTTNPEEEAGYKERNELDKALMRGVLPLKMKEQLTSYSVHLATSRYFTYRAGNCPKERPNGCILELYHYADDLGKPLAAVVSAFHHSFVNSFKTGTDTRGKSQGVVTSIDQIARLADYMLRFQVYGSNGEPDLVETLKRGVERVYLKGLGNEEKKEAQRKTLHSLLNGEKLLQTVGITATPAQKIQSAVHEIMKTHRSRRGGYSADLADQIQRARTERLRGASDEARNDLLSRAGVDDAVKDLLKRRPPNPPPQ